MEQSQALTQHVLRIHSKSRALSWVDNEDDSISSPKRRGHITSVPGSAHLRVSGSFICLVMLEFFVLPTDVSLYTTKDIISVVSTRSLTDFQFYWHPCILWWGQMLDKFCHYLLKSSGPGQNPVWHFRTDHWKLQGFVWQASWTEFALPTPDYTPPIHCKFLERIAVKDPVFLFPNPTNHAHTHSYIPNTMSPLSPPCWWPWLNFGHFSLLWLSTFLLLALLSLSPSHWPIVHEEAGTFVQGFLTGR